MPPSPKVLLIGSPDNGLVPSQQIDALRAKYDLHVYEFSRIADFHQSMQGGGSLSDVQAIIRIGLDMPEGIERPRSGWTGRALSYYPASLRVVGCFGHGSEEEDVVGLRNKGVEFFSTTGGMDATATAAIYLIISAFRHLSYSERMLRTDHFRQAQFAAMKSSDPQGKTLGIVGMGSIGKQIARYAAAIGMEIHCLDRPSIRAALLSNRTDGKEVVRLPELVFHPNLESLISEVDCVLLACPYTTETRHLLSGRMFQLMKPGVRIVSVARGKCIDEDALCSAIEGGIVRGYGTDVHYHEPEVNPRLFQYDCVTLLPHVGGLSRGALRNHAVQCLKKMDELLSIPRENIKG
ncbi:hypothetical protein B0T10DRAFT_496375 [Thelonectria olida]|uniref:D-isomer specific 2-hydroxyacid dehydrogenase NAD-binding domain-containing protein n=1 Tax=Thelonectria olida TaxID=1576542 RepID=A0A9P8VXI7_9HYPO|nr:hypothetical protein B0T10DRAFT_496375 [Thelonectria olida]